MWHDVANSVRGKSDVPKSRQESKESRSIKSLEYFSWQNPDNNIEEPTIIGVIPAGRNGS